MLLPDFDGVLPLCLLEVDDDDGLVAVDVPEDVDPPLVCPAFPDCAALDVFEADVHDCPSVGDGDAAMPLGMGDIDGMGDTEAMGDGDTDAAGVGVAVGLVATPFAPLAI